MSSFPWPVTDDELLLTQAFNEVLASYDGRGEHEEAHVTELARDLVVEAYEHGVRDQATITQYVLRELRYRIRRA